MKAYIGRINLNNEREYDYSNLDLHTPYRFFQYGIQVCFR